MRGSFRRRITRYAAQCCLYVNERCADTRLPFFKCSHSTVLLPDRTEQLPLYGSQAVGRDRDLIQPVGCISHLIAEDGSDSQCAH